jgi:N6-adenosine-specific RNA methylase IME4
MTVDQIVRFPLPPLADDCMLMLWRVAAMQQEALDVMRFWGFTLKSEVVWEKLTKHGKQHIGMGHYVRASHEVCLIGTRGRVQVQDRSVRSSFQAPVQEHSSKPDRIYEIAERLLPGGPYVELFARRVRSGWLQHGHELEGTSP